MFRELIVGSDLSAAFNFVETFSPCFLFPDAVGYHLARHLDRYSLERKRKIRGSTTATKAATKHDGLAITSLRVLETLYVKTLFEVTLRTTTVNNDPR